MLGPSGVEKNLGVPELSKFENCLLCNCLPYIRNEIARAIWLVCNDYYRHKKKRYFTLLSLIYTDDFARIHISVCKR